TKIRLINPPAPTPTRGHPRQLRQMRSRRWDVMDVEADVRPPRGPHSDARLRADARGGDGSIRQELAAGGAPTTNHHEERTPLPALVWAVVFTILLVAAVAIFVLVLIRQWHHESQPATPSACPPQFLRLRCRACDFILLVNAQIGLPLSGCCSPRTTGHGHGLP